MANKLFAHLKGDLFGGLTAGIVALPLALAFGVSSGLGPSAGLYGAIFIGFFASLFGGTNTQISGPTAPMTAVSMVVIAGLISANEGDVAKALPAILIIFLVAGIFQILLGISGLGKYIKYIPYPVVSGFMTAIGVMILITQVLPLLGYYVKDDSAFIEKFNPKAEEVILNKLLKKEAGDDLLVINDFENTIANAQKITPEEVTAEALAIAKSKTSGVIGAIKSFPRAFSNINFLELILGLVTIVIIYGFKRITTSIPSTLVALVLVSGTAYVLNLEYRPIEKIPGGFPMPNLGIFTDFKLNSITPYIFTSLSLAFLGAIDSLLTSIVADNMTKTRHNPNRELIGQGIGNSVAAIFGGIPGAGATIRTVVNINAGGKTKLSGMIAGILLLFILLALGPVASQIPAAVLAGILITVGIGVMDYKGIKAMPKMPKVEVVVMLIVMLLSVFWNLVYAVGIGLVLASLIFMKKMGDLTARQTKITPLGNISEGGKLKEYRLPENLKNKVVIKDLDGPLFFGATADLQQLSKQIPEGTSKVILKMDNVPYIDQSGLYAMEDIIFGLNQKEVIVYIVALEEQPRTLMQNIDIIPDLVPKKHIFDKLEECLEYIQKNHSSGVS